MNIIETKCVKCKEDFLMSIDELRVFGNGICPRCIDPVVRHIRDKIVYGFYDIPSVKEETIIKLVNDVFGV